MSQSFTSVHLDTERCFPELGSILQIMTSVQHRNVFGWPSYNRMMWLTAALVVEAYSYGWLD